MADPGTVLAIVGLLAETVDFCFQIIKKACKAPDEIKRLNAEAANWRPQLESLADLLEGDSPSATRLREKFEDGGLHEIKDLVKELNEVLAPFQNLSRLRKFHWSLTAGNQVEDLLSQLQQGMGRILGNLQIETHLELVGLHKEIRKIQLFETDEYERRNILEWLKPEGIDCHDFHRRKRDLREEGTCDWLAKSPPWLDWCDGGSPINARFLWIYGLPGAGKTVLASFAIDHVASEYQHKGVSYYYCSHERQKQGHTSSEEACSFLRWVIRDLTAQVTRPKTRSSNHQAIIPQTLEDLYVKHDFTAQNLLDCLLAVTEYIAMEFDQQVCIVVDAVDESPSPRSALLNILTTIGTDPRWQHVSLCFTSRKEPDIFKAIEAIQPAQPSHLIHLPKPARRASSASSSGERKILTPVGPSRFLPGNEGGGVVQSGFDGMPPPTPSGNARQRGRNPSGVTSHRVSRSESRPPSGYTTPRRSGEERSASMHPAEESHGVDAMDIDGPRLLVPSHSAGGCTILSMDHNPQVQEAIRTFVRSQLRDQYKFKGGDRDLEEVITLIASKAKGMFRWAACQVDIIIRSNLCDMDSISAMLERIPPDIFGTYEHMITKLPDFQGQSEHNRNFARTALALLCSSSSGVSCAEVLVEASRFDVPHGSAHKFNLAHLEKILGCLITVTSIPRRPDSMYSRQKEGEDVKKQVSVAHYTVKEYLFDESTALGSVKEFALSTEAIQNLELQVIFSGLRQFKGVRASGERPTRYEEYCLKMTDKALKERRGLILRDKAIWKDVTECLKWNSNHQLPRSGAFPNMRVRATFSSWTKTSPFEQNKEPKRDETSVLVSLLLLHWPELAVIYLEDLPESTKKQIWKDKFELARNFKLEGTNPTTLMQMCVTRRDVPFLQVLIKSRADFSGEKDLVMDLFYHAYGHGSLDDEDGGAKTGKILKMLLERGVRPEAPGYIFTPLQFAVSNLEDRWVYDLLYEGAEPNATGCPSGVHPFGIGHDDIQGHLTPLQICKDTTPKWLQSEDGDEELRDARAKVEFVLRQWGAVDAVETVELDSD